MKRDDSHDIDSMLELARDVAPPTEEDKSRVRTKLAVKLGGAGLATGAVVRVAHQAAGAGAKSALGGAAAKWLGVAIVATGIGGGWVALRNGLRSETPPAAEQNRPVERRPAPAATSAGVDRVSPALAAEVAGAPPSGDATDVRVTPRVVAPRKPMRDAIARASEAPPMAAEAASDAPLPSESAPNAPSLHANLAVLRGVHAHLSSRHYDDALHLLETHGAALARTPLAEEARALEVMARCGAHAADAREKRESFSRDYPGSVHLARIESTCGSGSR
jgi:hypothetical protein